MRKELRHGEERKGVGGVALIQFPDLLLLTKVPSFLKEIFSCTFQPRSEPPSLQFPFNFGITLGLYFGSFGIILVHLFRS